MMSINATQLFGKDPTKPSLEGVRAKLARAKQHIKAFEEARKNWRALMVVNPPITLQENPSYNRPKFVLTSPKIDSEISLIVGDYVHNLRACLDHLIGQLALKEGHDIAKHSSLAFPACISESAYKKFVQTKITPFIHCSETIKIIDTIQPYHRKDPKSDPLWVLSELDNIDKHRKLVVITPNLTNRGMLEVVGSSENLKEEVFDPIADKDLIIFQIEIWPTSYVSAKEAGAKARALVLRADATLRLADTGLSCDGWSVQKSLDLIANRVNEIVDSLSNFF